MSADFQRCTGFQFPCTKHVNSNSSILNLRLYMPALWMTKDYITLTPAYQFHCKEVCGSGRLLRVVYVGKRYCVQALVRGKDKPDGIKSILVRLLSALCKGRYYLCTVRCVVYIYGCPCGIGCSPALQVCSHARIIHLHSNEKRGVLLDLFTWGQEREYDIVRVPKGTVRPCALYLSFWKAVSR